MDTPTPAAQDADTAYFSQSGYREALSYKWEAKKAKRPKFSLRSLAARVGVRSAASLSRLFRGELHVSEDVVVSLCRALDLSPLEREYALSLFRAEKSAEPETRKNALAHAAEVREFVAWRGDRVPLQRRLPWMDHLGFTLREMVELAGFRADPSWMKARLRLEATEEQVREKWNALVAFGGVERDAEGVWRASRSVQAEGDMSVEVNKACFAHFARALEKETDHEARRNAATLYARSICCSVDARHLPDLARKLETFYEELFFWISSTPVPVDEVVEIYLGMGTLTAPERAAPANAPQIPEKTSRTAPMS